MTHVFNLDELSIARSSWGLFRDRRPELYGPLTTLDGKGNDFPSTVTTSNFEMPAEWFPHSRCWMLWVSGTVWTNLGNFSFSFLLITRFSNS